MLKHQSTNILCALAVVFTTSGCGDDSRPSRTDDQTGGTGGTAADSGADGGTSGGGSTATGGASGTGGSTATGGSSGASGASGGSGTGGGPGAPPATLLDYWEGNARWNLYRALPPETAQRIKVVDGVWYGFSRTLPSQTEPNPMCPGTCGTVVRVSNDQGRTWSEPTVIIAPEAGTAWGCCATDGDAYYDPATNEWSYLLQCSAEGHYETNANGDQVLIPGAWNGCLFKRSGPSPVGPFTAQGIDNPVVRNGELWSQICDDPVGDDCLRIPQQEMQTKPWVHEVNDEGTFQIIEKRDGYFYVHMHGTDGERGYAGVVRSMDLQSFEAADPALGTPDDAIHDRDVTDSWRESWAGGASKGGASNTIAVEGGYYYMLADGVDLNLACTPGQNWDIGLLRSASLSNTQWEGFPQGNPILYSSHRPDYYVGDGTRVPLWCGLQYWGLFQDDVTKRWYMFGARLARYSTSSESHVLVYELDRVQDQLDNGSFWKCNDEGWSVLGTVDHTVVRDPNRSSDFTCFLEFDCGSDGCVGDEVRQDVDAVDLRGETLRFTADLSADQPAATVELSIQQLDANGEVIATTSKQATLNEGYQAVGGTLVVEDSAQLLRYSILPQSAGSYQADGLVLAPVSEGGTLPSVCDGPYGPILHGQTRVYYAEDRAVRCRYQNRTCTSGVLSGDDSFEHQVCEDLHDGLIERLYQGLLDRDPDQAGLDYWRAEHIDSTRGTLVSGFVAACDASLAQYPPQDYPLYGLDYYQAHAATCEGQLAMIFDAFFGASPTTAWLGRCQTDLAPLTLIQRAEAVAMSGTDFEYAWGGAW